MKAIVAVGWRPGEETRERNWSLVQAYYRRLGLPVHHEDSDPDRPFNLAQAVNRAVSLSGEWDVVVIPDADTVIDPAALQVAVQRAYAGDLMVQPTTRYWRLNEDGSVPAVPETFHAGGVHVFSRYAWDELGGYDERFDRWGGHDSAMLWAAATLGLYAETDGDVYHLWHPQNEQGWMSGASEWEDVSHDERVRPLPPLAARYRDAMGDPTGMSAILMERVS